MPDEKKDKTIGKTLTVLNRTTRSFQTTCGVLEPNASMELPEKEAHFMLDYNGVVDAEKFIPAHKIDANLRAENTQLKQENDALKKKVADLEAQLAPKGKGK